MKKPVLKTVILTVFTILFGISTVLASSQHSIQADAEIINFDTQMYVEPVYGAGTISGEINFQNTFIPPTGTKAIFGTLDPVIELQTLRMYDLYETQGFRIQVSMTNLRQLSAGEIIPYDKISIVTLSRSLTDPIDILSTNHPPLLPGDYSATYDCVAWDNNNDILDCDPLLNDFSHQFAKGTAIASSNLADPVNPGDPSISLINVSDFETDCDIHPEKCFIKIYEPESPGDDTHWDDVSYTGINLIENTLLGVDGISRQHDPILNPLISVKQYSPNSVQKEILRINRLEYIGKYAIGFGIKIIIDSNLKTNTHSDEYSGTLTFTLTSI